MLAPRDAMGVLRDLLGADFPAVQEVRFTDYVRRQDDFRYTLAVVWTRSSASARQAVFDVAPEMVRRTGWYPLLQGERLDSARGNALVRLTTARPSRRAELGALRSLESAVGADGGCSLRIRTSQGSLLLDTGLPGALKPEPDDRVVFLTHSHQDHTGGLPAALRARAQIVMPPALAELLSLLPNQPRRLFDDYLSVDPGTEAAFGAIRVSAFPVPHSPGAVGYQLTDDETSVVYTGDLSLQTARHDFVPHLHRRLEVLPGTRWLLLDATMAGRPAGASGPTAAKAVIAAAESHSDVIVTARDPELLLYAYLDVYKAMTARERSSGRFPCLVAPVLRPILRVLHAAITQRRVDALDAFILAQYGRGALIWGESAWLYWLDGSDPIPDGPRIWFVPLAEMSTVRPGSSPTLIFAGRGSLPDDLGPLARAPLLKKDTGAWTLHSAESELSRAVVELEDMASVALFHNFPKRLKQFSRRLSRPPHVVSSTPISLTQ